PRRSLIDIVQTVGRVLRPAPGKDIGTIIIPVALPADGDDRAPYAGESLTAAIQDLHRFHGLRLHFVRLRTSAPALKGEAPHCDPGFASCYGPHRRSRRRGF